MLSDLTIRKTERSRLPQVDYENLGFGDVFSDHMFTMRHSGGRWQEPRIVPFGPIPLSPAVASLHYGQSVFEGLKAFRGHDGLVRLFRPEMNARRLRESCRRLCVPVLDEETCLAAIRRLVALDHAWIPSRRGQALYIRPIIISNESQLEVRPSEEYLFIVFTAPVRTYYEITAAPVALKVQDRYTRSAPGGIGFAKTAGNYAAALLPGEEARQEGFGQALWLDGAEHRYVEEVGQMNIFFKLNGTVVTPALQGTILPGVTRDSVITLLRDRGVPVEERRITIDEVCQAIRRGDLEEAFGAGTAAVVSPVGRIAFQGETLEINDNKPGPLTGSLYEEITAIHFGETNDRHGWTTVVATDAAAAAAAE